MKLREFGFIVWLLSKNNNEDDRRLGETVSELAELVEDWSKDNALWDADNVNWIRETYNEWKLHQVTKSTGGSSK